MSVIAIVKKISNMSLSNKIVIKVKQTEVIVRASFKVNSVISQWKLKTKEHCEKKYKFSSQRQISNANYSLSA